MENFEQGIVGTGVGAVSLESGLKNCKSLEIARPFDVVFWPHSVEKGFGFLALDTDITPETRWLEIPAGKSAQVVPMLRALFPEIVPQSATVKFENQKHELLDVFPNEYTADKTANFFKLVVC